MITPPLWERPLHQRGAVSKVFLDPDHVTVLERCSRLVRLNRRDGSVLWDTHVGAWPRDIVRADDAYLVLAPTPDRLTCLDVATGTIRWQVDVMPCTGHIAVIGDVVLIGGWRDGTPTRAYDLRTGAPLWHAPHPRAVVPAARLGADAVSARVRSSRVSVFEPRTGAEVRRIRLPDALDEMHDTAAFVPMGSGRLLVRRGANSAAVLREGSDVVAELPLGGAELPFGVPEYAAGTLFVREGRTAFRAVDPADGSLRWRVDIAQSLAHGVAPTTSGFAVVTGNGTLLDLDPQGHVVRRLSLHRRVAEVRGDGGPEVFVLARGTVMAVATGPAG
ncbi:PQQ-binding-like beta-propeller repeat protein [Embleya sp. AB8]|uniref:outer membrane protein assembly factor BamB family protein n=1 Tax=Embleya sp. AB8 TaxID=3156304 RepID=UPI003C77B9C4